MVDTGLEEGLGTVQVLACPGSETGVVEGLVVSLVARSGAKGVGSGLKELAGVGEVTKGIGVISLLDIFLTDALDTLDDIGGLGALGVVLVSVLVGVESLVKRVVDDGLGDLDYRELTCLVELIVSGSVGFLEVLGAVDGDVLLGGRTLTGHDKLELLGLSADPTVAHRCIVCVHVGRGEFQPSSHLGGLLGVVGGSLCLLKGGLGCVLGFDVLSRGESHGCEQCQCEKYFFHKKI